MLSVSFYVPVYDIQSEEKNIPKDVDTEDEWDRFKQKKVSEFLDNFEVRFEKGGFQSNPNEISYDGSTPPSRRISGYEFEDFGKGVYSDNEMNRRLNRVGEPYDRGEELREKIKKMVNNKNVKVSDEVGALKGIVERIKKEDPLLVPDNPKRGDVIYDTWKETFRHIMEVAEKTKKGFKFFKSNLKLSGYTNEEIEKMRKKYL